MPHVNLRLGVTDTDDRAACLVVDGVDITKAVLADGFKVDITQTNGIPTAVVSMQLIVDRLDMDLPDAVLNASTFTGKED